MPPRRGVRSGPGGSLCPGRRRQGGAPGGRCAGANPRRARRSSRRRWSTLDLVQLYALGGRPERGKALLDDYQSRVPQQLKSQQRVEAADARAAIADPELQAAVQDVKARMARLGGEPKP